MSDDQPRRGPMTLIGPRDSVGLAAALAKVQGKLPKLERDRTVTVEPKDPKKAPYSYSYVTLANLSDAILPLLAEHGLAFVALPGSGADGKMCIRYRLLHESGESLDGEFPISGEGGIQMIGGRITYARRYCLAAIVGVAADEDDEARLSEGPAVAQRAAPPARPRRAAAGPPADAPTAQRRQPAGPTLPGDEPADDKVTTDQHRHMHALWRELGYAGEEHRDRRLSITAKILDLDDLESSADLTRAQGDQVIAALRERAKKVKAASGEAAE